MNARIFDYLDATPTASSPRLVIDLHTVAAQYDAFRAAMPDTGIYYAVKANPAAAVLSVLAAKNSSFDAASPAEIDAVLAVGASPNRISYGNTIKKEADIAAGYARGVRMFAFDCEEELQKLARSAPGSEVFCRILCDCVGAEWPLSRKFGCDEDMAGRLLVAARDYGLKPCGVSFHVGSQQNDPDAWSGALSTAARIFTGVAQHGITLDLLNLGGGFPVRYDKPVPDTAVYGTHIVDALHKHFPGRTLRTVIEPGRGMTGAAGVMESEVVLVARKHVDDSVRWVYLDIGKFGGLLETLDESIRYPIVTPHDGGVTGPCIVAGPTCDSIDVLYEKKPYALPEALRAGDRVRLLSAGAYTVTYAAVSFNGFTPPEVICI